MNLTGEVMQPTVDVGHFRSGRHVRDPGELLDGASEFPALLGRGVQEPLLRLGEFAGAVELHQRDVEDVVPDVQEVASVGRSFRSPSLPFFRLAEKALAGFDPDRHADRRILLRDLDQPEQRRRGWRLKQVAPRHVGEGRQLQRGPDFVENRDERRWPSRGVMKVFIMASPIGAPRFVNSAPQASLQADIMSADAELS